MIILEGFLIGLAGSLHCIGMCGPIALLIPTSKNPLVKFFQIITYNFGRVLTYSVFGFFFGLLGKGFRIAEVAQYVSIITGTTIIIIALATLFSNNKLANSANKLFSNLFSPIKKIFSKSLRNEKKNLLAIGILNGFLPCGLVYGALLLTINANSITESVLVMAAFGIGTIPLMMLFMYFKSFINSKFNFNKIVPFVILIMVIFLVLRGMNLGIPYVSPKINKKGDTEIMDGCCSVEDQKPVLNFEEKI